MKKGSDCPDKMTVSNNQLAYPTISCHTYWTLQPQNGREIRPKWQTQQLGGWGSRFVPGANRLSLTCANLGWAHWPRNWELWLNLGLATHTLGFNPH